jgi:hypothetical protein
MSDTRIPAERAYAAERDGTLYTKPAETFTIAVQKYFVDEQAIADELLVTVGDAAGTDSDWNDLFSDCLAYCCRLPRSHPEIVDRFLL